MFDNEILSPNEKVKKIRKQIIRATQDEIAEGTCKGPNISRIESNKQNLTFILATGIARNFNRIAKRKCLTIELITAEWLMLDEDIQANEMLERNILNELEKIEVLEPFEEKIFEAESLFKKYNISDNIKIEIYKKAANFYFSKRFYYKSDEMCNKILEASFNSNNMLEEANAYTTKARNNLNIENYLEAIEQLSIAEKLSNYLKNDQLFERICFNKSLIYKKIKKYTEAIEHLKILQDRIKSGPRMLDIKMLYANCLNDMYNSKKEKEEQLFKEAEKEYISILEPAMQSDNKELLAMTYKNISELHFNKQDYKTAYIYICNCLENSGNNKKHNEYLFFAAEIKEKLGKDTEKYLLQALKFSEEQDRENIYLIEKIIYKLAVIYMERENEKGIDLMIMKTEELKIKYDLIFPDLSEYYRHRNEEKSISLIQKLINKSKRDKNI